MLYPIPSSFPSDENVLYPLFPKFNGTFTVLFVPFVSIALHLVSIFKANPLKALGRLSGDPMKEHE